MDFIRVFMIWVAFLAIMMMIPSSVGVDSDISDQPISDILAKYGLPIGLLPDSVNSYSLADDGRFTVELDKPCYVQFNYLVYYDKTITGKISYGKITDLDGIEAKEFFIWVYVKGIEVDIPSSGYVYFKVGFISKQIEISWFKTVPTCNNSLGDEPCNDIQTAVTEI